MRTLMFLPCVALLVAAAPASAQRPAIASQVAPSNELQTVTPQGGGGSAGTSLAPAEKKICKQLPTTGSRLPNRACLTAKQWKQVEDDLSH